jgi:hypothetical protein
MSATELFLLLEAERLDAEHVEVVRGCRCHSNTLRPLAAGQVELGSAAGDRRDQRTASRKLNIALLAPIPAASTIAAVD